MTIDWFSFGLGFVVGLIVMGAIVFNALGDVLRR